MLHGAGSDILNTSEIRCVKQCRESIPIFSSWNVDGMIFLGTFNFFLKNGLHVPEDISVIGFDNLKEGRVAHPQLTSISQHPEEKVHKAGDKKS